MRESIGGAWLFSIVIVFIFFFSGFLAYSISYTKAFNVKNRIVSYIEEYEGYTIGVGDVASRTDEELDKTVEGKSFKLVRDTGYNYTGAQGIGCDGVQNGSANRTTEGGYCVVKYCPNGTNNSNTHYKITTYIALNLPVVNVTVSGETRTIYSDTSGYACTQGVD